MFSKSRINEPGTKPAEAEKPRTPDMPAAKPSMDYSPSAPKTKAGVSVLSSDLTVVGNLERAAATAVDHARAVYLARHPQAQRNLELADFSFWMLRPLHARFIAGFGRMGWLDAATLLP